MLHFVLFERRLVILRLACKLGCFAAGLAASAAPLLSFTLCLCADPLCWVGEVLCQMSWMHRHLSGLFSCSLIQGVVQHLLLFWLLCCQFCPSLIAHQSQLLRLMKSCHGIVASVVVCQVQGGCVASASSQRVASHPLQSNTASSVLLPICHSLCGHVLHVQLPEGSLSKNVSTVSFTGAGKPLPKGSNSVAILDTAFIKTT